jgi:two-component system, NarL family, invasion response regulator UvrY
MYNILIADDHEIVILGVVAMVSGLYPTANFVFAKDGAELTDAVNNHNFDLIIMDMNMPRCNSLGILEWVLTKTPRQKLIIFSMSPEHIFARRHIKAGAKAYICKMAPRSEFVKAVECVMDGKVYLTDEVISLFASELQNDKPANIFQNLSPRELEIMGLLIQGASIAEICSSMSLQSSTVGTYKKRLLEKIGVKNILEFVTVARLNGVEV